MQKLESVLRTDTCSNRFRVNQKLPIITIRDANPSHSENKGDKTNNIGALSKRVTLYVGDTYAAIEKQLAKRQKSKRRWINAC